MIMKRILFFALLSVLFHSCTNDQSKPAKTSEYKNYITGLASPIRLKFDSTTVFLGDYFTDVNGIEKIEFSLSDINFAILAIMSFITYPLFVFFD